MNARSPSSALSHPFLGEGSPTKIDYRKQSTLILTSLLEDLEYVLIFPVDFKRNLSLLDIFFPGVLTK